MTETYTLVGHDPMWVAAIIPVPAVLLTLWMRRKYKSPPLNLWKSLIVVAYFFGCTMAGIPMEWTIAGAFFAATLIILISFRTKMPRLWMSLTLSAMFAFCGLMLLFMQPAILRERMTLSDSEVSFSHFGESSTVPRSGLRIDTTGPTHAWFETRPSSIWNSMSDRQEGPRFLGSSIFWGPHGLIRGDDLALHFARWAGVTPNLMTRHGKTFSQEPLPGFSLNDSKP